MSPRPRLPRQDCAHCGRHDRCTRIVLEEAVCQRCTLRLARTAQPCPGCANIRVLAFYDADRRPACAPCTGNEAVYACTACGSSGNGSGGGNAPLAFEVFNEGGEFENGLCGQPFDDLVFGDVAHK